MKHKARLQRLKKALDLRSGPTVIRVGFADPDTGQVREHSTGQVYASLEDWQASGEPGAKLIYVTYTDQKDYA